MPGLFGLRMRMFLATLVLFGVVFGFFYLIFWLFGLDMIWFPLFFAVGLIIVQWSLSSYLISAVSRIRWLNSREEHPVLWDMVMTHAEEAGVKIHKIGISEMSVPNAFVFGMFKSNLVVTEGLLIAFSGDDEALEGVVWHELGHVKNGDLKLMMGLSTLPMIFYMIAYSLMWSRSGRGSSAALIGGLAFGIYFLLNLGILLISRYREYLADAYSGEMNGDVGIVRGLAKITYLNKKSEDFYNSKQISLKSFFITEPEKGDIDYLDEAASIIADDEETRKKVLELMKEEKKKSGWEVFRTHPLTVNRIISLLELD